ncbi:MAG TPA: hypothetical protein DCP62_05190 [Erysipelotrichaceae bacterium]|nr:hypothetical protein [Erysipelotrichaceae bacterium]
MAYDQEFEGGFTDPPTRQSGEDRPRGDGVGQDGQDHEHQKNQEDAVLVITDIAEIRLVDDVGFFAPFAHIDELTVTVLKNVDPP